MSLRILSAAAAVKSDLFAPGVKLLLGENIRC